MNGRFPGSLQGRMQGFPEQEVLGGPGVSEAWFCKSTLEPEVVAFRRIKEECLINLCISKQRGVNAFSVTSPSRKYRTVSTSDVQLEQSRSPRVRAPFGCSTGLDRGGQTRQAAHQLDPTWNSHATIVRHARTSWRHSCSNWCCDWFAVAFVLPKVTIVLDA